MRLTLASHRPYFPVFLYQCIYMHLHAFTLPSVWPPSFNNNIGRFLMIFSGPEMGSLLPACRPAVLGCPASTDGIARPLPLVKSLALQRSLRTRCHHHLTWKAWKIRFRNSASQPVSTRWIPLYPTLFFASSNCFNAFSRTNYVSTYACYIMLHHATSCYIWHFPQLRWTNFNQHQLRSHLGIEIKANCGLRMLEVFAPPSDAIGTLGSAVSVGRSVSGSTTELVKAAGGAVQQ